MLFTLKKVIGGLLLPLPFLLLLMALGILLVWFTGWQKSGKTVISVSWLLLLLLSLQPLADRLLLPLDSRYPTWNGAEKVDYIVVLGGGYTFNPGWAPSSNLLNNSLTTVETHRDHILQKLDIHSIPELILYAVRKGIVS